MSAGVARLALRSLGCHLFIVKSESVSSSATLTTLSFIMDRKFNRPPFRGNYYPNYKRNYAHESKPPSPVYTVENPKLLLNNVFTYVSQHLGVERPVYNLESVKVGNSDRHAWKAILSFCWPQPMTAEGFAYRKSEAEHLAAACICDKLKELGVVDEHYRIIPFATNQTPVQRPNIYPAMEEPPPSGFTPSTLVPPVYPQTSSQGPLHPKIIINNYYRKVCNMFNNEDLAPKFITRNEHDPTQPYRPKWKTTLNLAWPENIVFETYSDRKADAEKSACFLAVEKLMELNVMDKDYNIKYVPSKVPDYQFENNGSQENEPHQTSLHPKVITNNFYRQVCNFHGDESLAPSIVTERSFDDPNSVRLMWKSTLTAVWPENIHLESVGYKKADTEKDVCAALVKKLKGLNLLTEDNRPQLHSRKEIRDFIHQQHAPYQLQLTEDQQKLISTILNKYQKELQYLSLEKEEETPLPEILDLITGQPYIPMGPNEFMERSHELFTCLERIRNTHNPKISEFILERQKLPIFNKKDEIIRLIESNQVVLISGSTGCGKSTQVPQYILESFVERLQGADCNIIVTQPRRLSTVSLAERLCYEMMKQMGDTIGYQIRLDSQLPMKRGAILFSTVGMLLQKLKANPNLDGVSHIIVDEAHERDVKSDFLFILLKSLMRSNPCLKVILMSATPNVNKLRSYFDCPVIDVSGFMFPVSHFYLPDIIRFLEGRSARPLGNVLDSWNLSSSIDYDLIAELIFWIDEVRPPGAILCFLPGWSEIQTVHYRLYRLFSNPETHGIFLVHSKIPHLDQAAIFERPGKNYRKIILSTNIAETSITIEDVAYVIDSGRQKQTHYLPDRGVTSLSSEWVTQVNVKQRQGRAGRVQNGECYHLYPESLLHQMKKFPVPEIQRISLEEVVMNAKVYCADQRKASDFLMDCIDPPSPEHVFRAVKELTEMGILDEMENLTLLGQLISKISTHPRLAKCLLYGSWLCCMDPILTIVAYLSDARDPFLFNVDNNSQIREVKRKFSMGSQSDHLAISRVYRAWEDAKKNGEESERNFQRSNLIYVDTMNTYRGLKELFAETLDDLQMITGKASALHQDSDENALSSYSGVIKACLCAGFTNNVLRKFKGEVIKNKIVPNYTQYISKDGQRMVFFSDSVNCHTDDAVLSDWFTFFSKLHVEESRRITVRDTSTISPLIVLLFCGKDLKIKWKRMPAKEVMDSSFKNSVTLSVDNSKVVEFECEQEVAEQLLQLRHLLNNFFNRFLFEGRHENQVINLTFLNDLKELL